VSVGGRKRLIMTTFTRFEIFTAMKIQVVILWVMTPCSDVAGYQCFGGNCCLHLQGEVKWLL